MATLTSTGLGSGLDINSIVEQLVAAERAPQANRLTQRESKANEELSALGKFKSALATFQGLARQTDGRRHLPGPDRQGRGRQGLHCHGQTAPRCPGTYSVEVMNLASAQRLRSIGFGDATTAVGTGTPGDHGQRPDGQHPHRSPANSLNDIRDAINDVAGQSRRPRHDRQGQRRRAPDHLRHRDRRRQRDHASRSAAAMAAWRRSPTRPARRPIPMLELQAAADANVVIDGFPVSSAEQCHQRRDRRRHAQPGRARSLARWSTCPSSTTRTAPRPRCRASSRPTTS